MTTQEKKSSTTAGEEQPLPNDRTVVLLKAPTIMNDESVKERLEDFWSATFRRPYHPRLWTSRELDVQEQASRLYDEGKPLWTREMLLDAEKQAASYPLEVIIHGIDGVERTAATRYPGQIKPKKFVVGFHGYRSLIKPYATWAPTFAFETYHFLGYGSCNQDCEKEGSPEFVQRLSNAFRCRTKEFEQSKMYEFLKQFVAETTVLEKVDKMICFGLGDLDMEMDDTPDASEEFFCRLDQHIFARSLVLLIEEKHKRQVRLFAQDPLYLDIDKTVLGENGFEVVGDYGAAGFTLIDDKSIVYSNTPNFPMREILAELPRPVIYIGEPSQKTPEENQYETYETVKAVITSPDGAVYGCDDPMLDPATPRTRMMAKEYTVHEIPRPKWPGLLGGSIRGAIMVRK
ncbi:hypothetical protein BKA67DRAFT_662879 [Truncatella angustata]|uniref:SRR1-like domain-containing protein n=1 Tax=Truncatella angustata TaxID=152316 RepID=A0A9P8UDY7_9PEZI|nr:uncharacterized protein BKA67DRAFT_662879 [Truncatella angustata]KAH6648159.1 hypothetical protein BKA67DRAFT_662879 [Truncatella angustata]